MTSRSAIAIVTTSLLLASIAGINAGEKLALRATPYISSAPSTIVVRATVARNAGNRVLHIGADSGSFYRSSEIPLDGDRAPLVTEVRLKNLPSGEYAVVAILRDQMGHETTARQTVMILSRSGER